VDAKLYTPTWFSHKYLWWMSFAHQSGGFCFVILFLLNFVTEPHVICIASTWGSVTVFCWHNRPHEFLKQKLAFKLKINDYRNDCCNWKSFDTLHPFNSLEPAAFAMYTLGVFLW
jgi:hypothetical protein